ncbi:MAG: adenosylcobalamin-dependent ribonucleoside-diphosphate reductase [Methanomassiliicoccales archaeon]|nr:MAG: adenosylcobalamin-dependent ribonucleoside-diphosphate reductase [Methanomassiliicoccales archaeon]
MKGAEPSLSQNAIGVLKRRYLGKNEKGEVVERPDEMFWRVAENVASADLIYDEKADVAATAQAFHDLMANLEFLPNSPTLMNAGRELQQLSACFVLPIDDSMESIFETIKNTAIIHKSGGGTGFSFSNLRPRGDVVRTTKGLASGPVSFMSVFDAATEAVKQGGTRRGANMGILRVDHPDILEFIEAKELEGSFRNFNLSVGIIEGFMSALEKDEEFGLVNPRTGEVTRKISASEVFDRIVDAAWRNGEPGVIFLDRINEGTPLPQLENIESTNPCGEQPLLANESCTLGSIVLTNMLRMENGSWVVDYPKLERVVRTSVRFLDNVIDVNEFPLKEIEQISKANRKIGLGVMGFADILISMGVRYDSEEALEVAEGIIQFISDGAKKESQEIASERGPFPNFKGSAYKERGEPELRNAALTTIAPTGSLSIIADCSSGIEPLFSISYVHEIMGGDKLVRTNSEFLRIARERGFYSEELMEEVARRGSVQDMMEIPEDVRGLFVTARDISPEWHVRIQAAFQEYVDNAVSKTVNFPNDSTKEDVRRVFLMAYQLGCKGITVYREGSRVGQVLRTY